MVHLRNCQRIARLVTRLLVLSISVLIALFWADALLMTTEQTVEIVMGADELKEQFEEVDDTPSDPQQASADEQEEMPEGGSEDHAKSEASREDQGGGQKNAASRREIPEPASAANHERPLGQRQNERPAPDETDVAEVSHAELNEPPTAPEPAVMHAAEEGSLASFSGQGVSADGPAESNTGGTTEPVWDLRFAERPSLQQLQRISRTALAVVRQRRGYLEIAAIKEGTIGGITTVDDFVTNHPEHRARQGVLLPRQWLADYADRLIKYGGGWQLWLLAQDDLFLEWHAAARRFVLERGHQWQNVKRLHAVLQLRPGREALSAKISLRNLDVRDSKQEVKVEPK